MTAAEVPQTRTNPLFDFAFIIEFSSADIDRKATTDNGERFRRIWFRGALPAVRVISSKTSVSLCATVHIGSGCHPEAPRLRALRTAPPTAGLLD